jgi:hypothetical protein
MNQSRSHITEKTVDDYLKIIGDMKLLPEDNLLVVTYNNLVPLFKNKCLYDNVTFVHWGSQEARGSNKFNEYNKALVIGWFRKPQHAYVASVMAINDIDVYTPLTDNVWSDANYLKDKLIADDMIQFFNRIRCRVAIDKDGNCKPVELYMFTGGNRRIEAIIKQSISNEMPNIKIKPWNVKPMKFLRRKHTKLEQRAETVIEYLRGNIDKHIYIDQKTLMDYFGFSRQIMNRLLKSKYFEDRLEEESIYAIRLQQRGNPIRFMLPTSEEYENL